MFVTFEGIEGSGKSTLLELLAQRLEREGKKVIRTREPGGTALGRDLRKILLAEKNAGLSPQAELLLFLADRAQHVHEIIIPALKANFWVLCDRYADSTIAYQFYGRGLAGGDLELPGTPIPDITFLLDMDAAAGLKRAASRNIATGEGSRFDNEALEFHKRVRLGFQELAAKYPARIRVLDAEKTPGELCDECLKILKTKKMEVMQPALFDCIDCSLFA